MRILEYALDADDTGAVDQDTAEIDGCGILAERKHACIVRATGRYHPCIDRLRPVADGSNDRRIERGAFDVAVVDDGAVCADAGQPARELALDANAAVVGDVESISDCDHAFREGLIAVDVRIGIVEATARHHRPVILDAGVVAQHEDAGGAKTAGLDPREIADHHIVGAGEDAVREIARCRQPPEVENVLAVRRRRQDILVEAGREAVPEIDDCHGLSPAMPNKVKPTVRRCMTLWRCALARIIRLHDGLH